MFDFIDFVIQQHIGGYSQLLEQQAEDIDYEEVDGEILRQQEQNGTDKISKEYSCACE